MSIVDTFLRRQELENRVWKLEKQMRIIQKLSLEVANQHINERIHKVTVEALKDADSK